MKTRKQDTKTNTKSEAEEILRTAKHQERNKRCKTVRIDARTLISVPVEVDTELAAERFRNNVNKFAKCHS